MARDCRQLLIVKRPEHACRHRRAGVEQLIEALIHFCLGWLPGSGNGDRITVGTGGTMAQHCTRSIAHRAV